MIALARALRQQADELELLALQFSPTEAGSSRNGTGAH
jgi:hypothetical protein